jgi:hypothetical protein
MNMIMASGVMEMSLGRKTGIASDAIKPMFNRMRRSILSHRS